MHYSRLLKEIRQEKGLPLRAFAKMAGISHVHLSRLEKNKSNSNTIIRITLYTAHKICTGIGYSFRKFLVKTGYIELSEVNVLFGQLSENNRDRLNSLAKSLLATRTQNNSHTVSPRPIMQYGELLRKIRTEKGVSQTWLESKTGISSCYLSQVENNRSTHNNDIHITLDSLYSICEGLKYPFDKFLEESGYLNYNDREEIDIIYDQLPDCDKQRIVSYAKYLLGEKTNGDGGVC